MEENKKIILYTIGCPKCKVLEKKMEKMGINYEICRDLDTMQSLNLKTAPTLQVDDKFMEFSEAVKWVNAETKEMA